MKKEELLFSVLLLPIDFLMLVLAGLAAYFLRTSDYIASYMPVLFNFSIAYYLEIVLIFALIWVVIFALAGLYRLKISRSAVEEFFHIMIASSAGVMFIFTYIFLKHEWFNSRFIILAAWGFAIIFVFLGRFFVRKIKKYLLIKRRFGAYRSLLIGQNSLTKKIYSKINKNSDCGYIIIKQLTHLDFNNISNSIRDLKIDTVILADHNLPQEKVLELIDFCNDSHLDFRFVPNLFETMAASTSIDTTLGIPLVEFQRTKLDGWGRVLKRIIDIFGSVIGLILLSPLFAVIGAVIKLDSSGPALVKLKRISQGKEFNLYKFRSMIDGAEKLKAKLMKYNERQDGPLFKMKNDPRITRIGKHLRKTRIDELPQLINVFKGEMSLIGPRPHEPQEVEQYARHHKKVLAIKPGMTGLAQISGSSDLAFEEEVKIDSYYIDNWSLFLDIKILLKTFVILFRDRSAV